MRNRIESKVQRFLGIHKRQHLYATVAILLSLVVILGVTRSLIKPAISATSVSGEKEVSNAILLVGKDNSLYQNASEKTVASITELANSTYALGIASQFAVFLEDDFIVKEADTEGRVAVGGGIDASDYHWEGGLYPIGTGHYLNDGSSGDGRSHIPFNELGYGYFDTAARGIVNNSPFKNVLTPNDADWYDPDYGYTVFALYEGVDLSGVSQGPNYDDYLYQYETQTTMIDFDAAFTLLKQRSDVIDTNAVTAATTVTIDQATQTVTFDAHASGQVADAVMFNITEEQWAIISEWENAVYFNFRNIPELSTPLEGIEVINTDGDYISRNWYNSYIVVNVQTGADAKIPFAQLKTNISGDSNPGLNISNGDEDVVNGVSYTNPNNKLGCETLLYNFSSAETLVLGQNFQGTIFAPNADVTDKQGQTEDPNASYCPGHLSGALIAKSFEGYTEFGYRTYTGPITILGTTTSYEITVDKFDTEGKYLPGATLALYECDNAGNLSANPVAEWVSGTSTKVVNVEAGKKYVIKEVVAPEGYALTDQEYYFTVTESAEEEFTFTTTKEVSIYETTYTLNKVAWKNQAAPDFRKATIYVTVSDGSVLEFNALEYESGAGEWWHQVKGLSDIENVVWLKVVVEGGTENTLEYYINGKENGLQREGIDAGTTNIFGVNPTTKTETYTATYSYVPRVTINRYTNQYFNVSAGSDSYSTTNLNNTYYEIGGVQYSGTQLQNNAPNGVEIVSSRVGSETRYFIFYNDEFVTPIIKLGNFDFVNEKQEDVVVGTGEATITVDKLDQDGNFLSGATLGLYTVDNNGNLSVQPVAQWMSGLERKTVSIEFDTRYAIKEISPPDGYTGTDDIYYFILQNGDEQVYEIEPEITENTTTTQLWSGRFDFGNWEGYQILDSGVVSQVQVGDVIRVYVTDSATTNSIASIQSIDWKDMAWSNPYPIVDGKQYADFVVTSDVINTVRNGIIVKGCYATATKVELRRTTTTVTSEAKTFNYVPNVELNVYDDAYFRTKNNTLSKVINLDYSSNSFYNINGEKLQAGVLTDTYLKEHGIEKVEHGGKVFYLYKGDAITPLVTSDSLQTFTFVNEKIILGANVTLEKVDADNTEQTLSNSRIELYDSTTNTRIATYTLGISNITNGVSSSYILKNGLKPGSYYFKEVRVPDGGYLMPDDNTFEFVVNEDGTITEASEYLEYSSDNATLLVLNEQGIYVEKVWQDIYGNVIEAPIGSQVTINVYKPAGTDPVEVYSMMRTTLDDEDYGVNLTAGEDVTWYTIGNILSNYIVFVEGDIITTSHMVGAIAAGGDFSVGSWGEGQIAPTVIGGEYIKGQFSPGGWLTDEQKENASDKVYYNYTSVDLSFKPNFIQYTDYLDFTSAMQMVKNESQAIADSSYEITMNDITVSNQWFGTQYSIDLSTVRSRNIKIPYSIFTGTEAINFTGVSLTELATGGYTISVTGVGNNDVDFSFADFGDFGTKILLNGSGLDLKLKQLSGVVQGGQLNLVDGMNLTFNFPDAVGTITTYYLSGHIVAPRADVELTGGNFEGGVIAKSLTSQGQGHFYSYKTFEEIDIYDSENDYGNGSVTNPHPDDTIILNGNNDWKSEVPDIGADDYNNGDSYIKEEAVPGYMTDVSEEAIQQEDGTYLVVVTNRKQAYTMPSTGGGGTKNLVTAGAIILSAACIGLVAKRRKTLAKINKVQR